MKNSSDFSRIASYMKTWLSYKEIFGFKPSKAEIIRDIKSINLEEALTILAKLSVADEQYKNTLITALKPHIIDSEMIESVEPFDLINLLYGVKWFIAYGDKTPKYTYDNTFDKPYNVFLTVLKITDYMVEKIDSKDEVENMVMQSWLFNRPGEIDRSLIRQYEMFQNIALNKDLFQEKDYIDIHTIFSNEYGYSIEYYVSILLSLHQQIVKSLNINEVLSTSPWGINLNTFFDKINDKSIAKEITNGLILEIDTVKSWAKETIDNPFDYEVLLSKPLFKSNDMVIPFSPGFLNSTIFDGLCFKLNSCCSKVKKDFFPFFGLLFEQYVANTLKASAKSARKVPYKYIDEFPFGKKNDKSSDAYLLLGRSLLIFECKGGRLRKETKILADPTISQKDYEKYALDPIKQANKAYKNIISTDPLKFNKVNKVYILSVSLQAFPKIPKYNKTLDEIEDLHPDVKVIDYISLSELELLAYIINNHDFSLFKFILNKKRKDEYIPYQNYYYKKYGVIKRADVLENSLKQSTELMIKTLLQK